MALRALLQGRGGAYRDIVLLNAAAALIIAGRVADLKQGVELAESSIGEGRAEEALVALIEVSHGRLDAAH